MATHGKGSVASVALLLALVLAFATLEVVPAEARALDAEVEQTPQRSNDMDPLISDLQVAACSSAALLCEGLSTRLTCRPDGEKCTFNRSCCSGYCSNHSGYICKKRQIASE